MAKIKGPFTVKRGSNRVIDGRGNSFAFGACATGDPNQCDRNARRIAKALNAAEGARSTRLRGAEAERRVLEMQAAMKKWVDTGLLILGETSANKGARR